MRCRILFIFVMSIFLFGCENSLFRELTEIENYEKQTGDYSSDSTYSENSIANKIMNMTSSGTVYITGEVDSNIFSVINGALFSLHQKRSAVLVTLDFSDTTGLTKITDKAFYDAENLSGIILPNTVLSIGEWAFFKCTRLTNIIIPDSVTEVSPYAFQKCTNLTTITLGSGVKVIEEYVFFECENLTYVNIGSGVTYIKNHSFYNCSNLLSLTIPYNVSKIGSGAFYGCANLSNVTFVDTVSIWYYKWSEDGSESTEIGVMSPTDTEANASLLTSFQDSRIWYKNT